MLDLTTIILILVVMAVLAAMIYLIPIIKKWADSKGINIADTLITTDKIIEVIQLFVKQTNILPIDKQFLIDNVVEIIQTSVKLAQKLYEDGQCPGCDRTDKAIELVFNAIKAANITITDAQHDIIVKTVKMLVLLLGG